MNTVWVEGNKGFYLGAQAFLIEDARECAWAERHIVANAAHAWVLGKYVEADRANSNRQYFSLDGLRLGQSTIAHAPMNLNHQARNVVGAFVATDMVHPTEEQASAFNPYIEALGVVWKAYFPAEFAKIQDAHANGQLFFSMECVPRHIACIGDGGCGQKYEYAGRQSATYCDHLNGGTSDKDLIEPHFTAGAILVPPAQPGWKNAEIHSLVARHAEAAERVYDGFREAAPQLSSDEWLGLMAGLLHAAGVK